jgi:WD40 repeat protein
LAFSPSIDLPLLAIGGHGGLLLLWSILGDNNCQPEQLTLCGHTFEVRAIPDCESIQRQRGLPTICSVCFSPDGRTLATGELGNNLVRFWSIENRLELTALRRYTQSPENLSFSPDGDLLQSLNYQLTDLHDR